VNPRGEPLLWLQLIAIGVLPLEALALLLILAGNDPGPLPALERLFCWALGALAPALLLWRQPADVWSLLFAQTPSRGRRDLQRRLSALQAAPLTRWGMAAAAVMALPLLWWLDGIAGMATGFSPLSQAPRLTSLMVCSLLLAVMLWQWQQWLQALWLLRLDPETIAATAPMTEEQLQEQRLCLGIPLLLPDPLNLDADGFKSASRPSAPSEPRPRPDGTAETSATQGSDAAVPSVDLGHDCGEATHDTTASAPPQRPPSAGG
jgi:hypothetical protein